MKQKKTRRKVTAAQKQKSEERKAAFRCLVKTVAAMSDAQRAELAGKSLVATVEGRTLSPTNQILVLMQLARAVTLVGGFRQWLANGRCVRKGERGAFIWIPTGAGKGDADPQPTGQAGDAGDAERLHFVTGTVFDISQTEPTAPAGAPLNPDGEPWNYPSEPTDVTNEAGELIQ